MKVVIVGAGAIGGLVGGLLAAEGKEITIVGKNDFVEAVRKNGLKIKRVNGSQFNTAPNVTSDIEEVKGADALLLCVKSQDTVDVCNSIKDYIGKSTVIFSLQNGVRNAELINNVLMDNKVVRTVVMFNSIYLKPGEISQGSNGSLIVEDVPWAKGLVDYICKFNMLNAIGAATNLDTSFILTNRTTARIVRDSLKEGKKVITGSGKILKGMGNRTIDDLITLLYIPAFIRKIIMSRMYKMNAAMPSTLQSVLRGKRTEIDYLNGEIVKLAAATNQKATVNEALVAAVKEVEQSAINGNIKFFSAKELEKFITEYRK